MATEKLKTKMCPLKITCDGAFIAQHREACGNCLKKAEDRQKPKEPAKLRGEGVKEMSKAEKQRRRAARGATKEMSC